MPIIGTTARALCVLIFATLVAASVGATPAQARWLKAESERFVVYSEGGSGELTAFVRKLETFDRLLRLQMGLPIDEAPLRKLPIYLVEGAAGIREVRPGSGSGVSGFYNAHAEDIFAVAIRGALGDDVLLHEYAHHFMLQHFPYGYPAWFVEGFAEYFATVDINDERIVVGNYNRNRGDWLRGSTWLPMRELLGKRAGQVRKNPATYYPVAWLLTHWFMGTDERHGQLNAYLLDVGAGGDPVEAMPRATGMSNGELRSTLRRYMGRLPYYELRNPFPPAAVVVTELPAWADDLLLLSVRVKQESHDDGDTGIAAEARRAAARWPDEPFAQVVLGHAEIHFGDRKAGEAVLRQVIQTHPDNIEAYVYLAMSLLERDDEEGADTRALKVEAQGLLAQAYRLDDADYRIFLLMGLAREGAAGYPNENDIVTRELALQLAPQTNEARLMMAEGYLAAGRNEDAIRTALPLANNPHGGAGATMARETIARARGMTGEQMLAEEAAVDAAASDEEDGE